MKAIAVALLSSIALSPQSWADDATKRCVERECKKQCVEEWDNQQFKASYCPNGLIAFTMKNDLTAIFGLTAEQSSKVLDEIK